MQSIKSAHKQTINNAIDISFETSTIVLKWCWCFCWLKDVLTWYVPGVKKGLSSAFIVVHCQIEKCPFISELIFFHWHYTDLYAYDKLFYLLNFSFNLLQTVAKPAFVFVHKVLTRDERHIRVYSDLTAQNALQMQNFFEC